MFDHGILDWLDHKLTGIGISLRRIGVEPGYICISFFRYADGTSKRMSIGERIFSSPVYRMNIITYQFTIGDHGVQAPVCFIRKESAIHNHQWLVIPFIEFGRRQATVERSIGSKIEVLVFQVRFK